MGNSLEQGRHQVPAGLQDPGVGVAQGLEELQQADPDRGPLVAGRSAGPRRSAGRRRPRPARPSSPRRPRPAGPARWRRPGPPGGPPEDRARLLGRTAPPAPDRPAPRRRRDWPAAAARTRPGRPRSRPAPGQRRRRRTGGRPPAPRGSSSAAGPPAPTGSARPTSPLATAALSSWSMAACTWSLGSTPWNSGAAWPPMSAMTVGTACSCNACTMPGAVSTLIRASRNLPSLAFAISARASESC